MQACHAGISALIVFLQIPRFFLHVAGRIQDFAAVAANMYANYMHVEQVAHCMEALACCVCFCHLQAEIDHTQSIV